MKFLLIVIQKDYLIDTYVGTSQECLSYLDNNKGKCISWVMKRVFE